jgi:hypothetical protein
MNNPFSLSVVAPSQKSTPPNELVPLNDMKIDGSLFWQEKQNEEMSRPDLDSNIHHRHFSRASSHFSQSSDLFKKKILGEDSEILLPSEKLIEKKTSLKESFLENPVLNPNIVQHMNFNIPEPIFENIEEEKQKKQIEKNLMDERFEKKCKKISEQDVNFSSNIFSFHQMKANPNRKPIMSIAKPLQPPANKTTSSKEKCFYTNLFLTSKNESKNETPKQKNKEVKSHVNLSKINLKNEVSIQNSCKITGSRRGSKRDLSEIHSSIYSTQYPYTDPRKMTLAQLKIPKHIFLKLNGLINESPIPSIANNVNKFIFTNERKMQGRVKINAPMTPNVRFIKLNPLQFQTPKARPNLNMVLNSLNNQNLNSSNIFFPKAMTMMDLGKVVEPESTLIKSKKKSKASKNTTPKIRRKIIKKKNKNSSSKKKKNGCRCKKTHCTRLHCICFREKGYCTDSCSCDNCYNRSKFKDMISHIRELTEEINPLAFKSKIQVIETKSGQKIHNRGCSCTKNNCKKNYCECFKNGLPCSPLCKCENCKNSHVSLETEEVKKIFKKCSRKKKKFVIEIGNKNPEVHNIQMS